MDTESQVIRQCLEEVAETDTDLAPAIYARLSRRVPEIDQHIDYLDERMRGRMLDQIYQLLLDDVDEDYLKFETNMHKGYGADTGLYRGLLTAVKESVSEAMQESWTAAYSDAWDRTIERVMSDLDRLSGE